MEKVCIITGAANGIGRQVCESFLEIGYECVCIDYDKEHLTELKNDNENIHILNYDLMVEDNYKLLITDIGRIIKGAKEITLVNNLGGSNASYKYDKIWDNYFDTIYFNLKCLVELTEEMIPYMKEARHGRIVNISSISGRFNLKTINEDYAAAKAAIIGYSRIKATKLSKYGILVNTICPGIIETKRMKKRWEERDQEYNNKILKKIPLGRLGKPEEVAKAVRFLGGDDNTYITGAILDVNGGMYMP